MEQPATEKRSIVELAKALVKAQAQMPAAKKDADNPFYKTKYADLASVWEACRKPLTDNGLSVVQHPMGAGDSVSIHTMLLHISGEYLESILTVPVVKRDPQGFGSAITYARRYALSAIVGIAPEEDDGNAASNAEKDRGVKKPNPMPQSVRGLVKPANEIAAQSVGDTAPQPEQDNIPESFTPKTTAKKNEGEPAQEFYYNLTFFEFGTQEKELERLANLKKAGCLIYEQGNLMLVRAPRQVSALKDYQITVQDFLKFQGEMASQEEAA